MGETLTWTKERQEDCSMAQRKSLGLHACKHVPYCRRIRHQPSIQVERSAGRQTDYLIRRDGSLVSGHVAPEAIDGLSAFLFSQLIQTDPNRIEVRLVKGTNGKDADDTQHMISRLRQRLGEEMTIDRRVCEVEDLERHPIGNIRYAYHKLSAHTGLVQVPEPSRHGITPTKLKA